jgi:hypothetical protein
MVTVVLVVVIIIIMGHECIYGGPSGDWWEGEGKERMLSSEEDGSMLHVCI